MALLHSVAAVAHRLNFSKYLIVGHVNHGLRGKESEDDAAFVHKSANSLAIPCVIKSLNANEVEREAVRLGSREAAYRELRYSALRSVATQFGARYIMTAHTQDDQLETILHRLFRGTGPGGLAGMAKIRPLNDALTLARPLLNCDRHKIEEYLTAHKLDWREDSSNATLDYTRNRIRHTLVPVLDHLFPGHWTESILRLAQTSRDMETWAARDLDRMLAAGTAHSGESTIVELNVLSAESPFIVREFFRRIWQENSWPRREMGAGQWERLELMARGNGPARSEFPGGIVATRSQGKITLQPAK